MPTEIETAEKKSKHAHEELADALLELRRRELEMEEAGETVKEAARRAIPVLGLIAAAVALGAAWLIRKGAEIKAFSTVCPHAGCSIDWDAQKSCFACPCHGSVFSPDGERTDGPSPRGMDTLDVDVKQGRILVAYQRFRQGVRGKEPV